MSTKPYVKKEAAPILDPLSTPSQITFIDIETIPLFPTYNDMSARSRGLFLKRFEYEILNQLAEASGGAKFIEDYLPEEIEAFAEKFYREKASFLAEYSRIACIAVGYIRSNADGVLNLTLRSIIKKSETEMLNDVAAILDKSNNLLAHYGKEFDFPFMARRFIINKMPLPKILNTMGKKPWEVNLLDTMDLWKFGSMRHSVSLDQLCDCLGVDSPKTEISGKDVINYFYHTSKEGLPWETEEVRYKKVADYCLGDVISNVNCFLVMIGKSPILPANIKIQ